MRERSDEVPQPVPLDDVDRAILAALGEDGRLSIRELATRVHVGRATAHARLTRLVENEVIEAFTVRVDPKRAGRPLTALVTVQIEQRTWRRVKERVRSLPGVEYVALTTGDFDFVMLVRAPDMQSLRDVVLERLQSIPEVRATRTVFVLDEVR